MSPASCRLTFVPSALATSGRDSPIDTTVARRAISASRIGEIAALELAEDHHQAFAEALDRPPRRLDVGRLRVVHELDVRDPGHRLERMLETRETFDRRGHRRGAHAGEMRNRGRRHHVGQEMPSEQPHRRQRHEQHPRRWSGGRCCRCRCRCRRRARSQRHQQALRSNVARSRARPDRRRSARPSPTRLVLEDASLRGRIVLDGRVTIEVIRREVEQHGHPRMKRLDRFELEAARFDHVNRPGSSDRPARSGHCRCSAHHHLLPLRSIRPVSVVVVDLPLGAGDRHDSS